MKHLKKYNEAKKEYSLYDSCKDVFAELLDDKLIILYEKKDFVLLLLVHKFYPDYKDGNFFNYLNKSEKWFELLKDIEVGYKRLKDEFGEIDLHIYFDGNYGEMSIRISKDKDYKSKLIKKIKDNVAKYGGRLTMDDMEVDSYPLYKYEHGESYNIEVLNVNSVDINVYNENGDLTNRLEVEYEKLEINLLEEIDNIIDDFIEYDLLVKGL